jgi:hypothetical protein
MTTTIVSCFYRLRNNRKRSFEEYTRWITSFLMYRTEPIVLYLEPSPFSNTLEELCKENGNPYRIVYRFFDDLAYGTPEWINYWKFVQRNDESSDIVCHEMHRIWANKCVLLEEVVRENPFKTSHFVWSDIGCWRGSSKFLENYLPSWPTSLSSPFQVLWINNLEEFRTMYASIQAVTLQEWILQSEIPSHIFTVAGAQFGGSAEYCLLFCKTMKEAFEIFRANDIQADTDQLVVAYASIWLEEIMPSAIQNVQSPLTVPDGADRWFAFQFLWSMPEQLVKN